MTTYLIGGLRTFFLVHRALLPLGCGVIGVVLSHNSKEKTQARENRASSAVDEGEGRGGKVASEREWEREKTLRPGGGM